MPAKSKSQQRFMGMVHAVQKGELSPSKVSDKVKDAAKSMKKKDAEDFASTKHKGKPEKVAKETLRKLRETIRQIVKENPSLIEKFNVSDINEIKVGSVYKDKQGNKYKVSKRLYGDQWQLTHTSDKKISFQTDEYSIGKTYKLVKEGKRALKAYNNIHKARNEFIERYGKLRKQLNTLKTESPNNEILRLEKQLYKFEMAFIEQSSKLLGSVSKIAKSKLTEAKEIKFHQIQPKDYIWYRGGIQYFVTKTGPNVLHMGIVNKGKPGSGGSLFASNTKLTRKNFDSQIRVKFIKKITRGQNTLWQESVNEGKKRYYQQDRVGSAKYTISYHDGKQKHKDGSDFFDIKIFRNKKDLAKFVNTLHKSGYVYGFNESINEATEYYKSKRKSDDLFYKKVGNKWYKSLANKKGKVGWYVVKFPQDLDKKDMNKINKTKLPNVLRESVNEAKIPRKALDANKVKNSDDFWKVPISKINRAAGTSFGRQREVGDVILWMNFAIDAWNKGRVSESVNEGKKRFKVGFNIGKAKYVISHHDGRQKHKDGSDFFGISIYKNKKAFEKGQEDLRKKGYIEESVNEVMGYNMKAKDKKVFQDFLDKDFNSPAIKKSQTFSVDKKGNKYILSGAMTKVAMWKGDKLYIHNQAYGNVSQTFINYMKKIAKYEDFESKNLQKESINEAKKVVKVKTVKNNRHQNQREIVNDLVKLLKRKGWKPPQYLSDESTLERQIINAYEKARKKWRSTMGNTVVFSVDNNKDFSEKNFSWVKESIKEKISKDEWAQYPKYARKLKPYLQKLFKVPIKVRVIKQANHNPWIEVRVAKFGKDIIPNDFRVKAAKAIGASGVRDWDNVNYGNIRVNSISLKTDVWRKLLGNKVKESVNEAKPSPEQAGKLFDKLLKKQTKGNLPSTKDIEIVFSLLRKKYGIKGESVNENSKVYSRDVDNMVDTLSSWEKGEFGYTSGNPYMGKKGKSEPFHDSGAGMHVSGGIEDALKALIKRWKKLDVRPATTIKIFKAYHKLPDSKKKFSNPSFWEKFLEKNGISVVAESINEGGMGILSSDQADILQAIVMRNKSKPTRALLNLALKSGHFKGVDKKELLGYIDGARQFVKYMKSHPMESVTKAKKYRAELNQYNRKKGTYGNNDGKDASHKGGKIVGFEKESTNRGRREKSRLKKEDIREDVGVDTYLGGIVSALHKAGIKPKTAKQMKHGFSKSRDKIGFFIEVEQTSFGKKEMYTLQVEIDRDGNLWYLSGHRPMKLGKWADTSKIVRMLKALNRLKGFGQDAIFKKR